MERILLLLILSLSLVLPATAQNATYLEVVVTADRIETAEVETAATVSVISAEDIEASSASSVPELLEALPGVQFRTYSGPAQAQISMGGFGENSFGRVVVLVDGRSQNNIDMRPINWMSISLASVERIEVLHGGGGVLYGNGAVGGVINIITRQTDAPLALKAEGSFGSFNSHRESVQAGVSGELGSIRVGGEFSTTEGYRDRTGSNSANANLTGNIYPTDRLAFDLDLNYTRSFYEMPGGISEAEYKEDPTQAKNLADESLEHEFGASVNGKYDFNDDLRVEVLLGYSYRNIMPDQPSFFTPQYDERISTTLDAQPKLRLKAAVAEMPLVLIIGVDLRSADISNQSYSDEDRETKTNDFDVAFFSVGGYANGDVELRDNLGLSAGLRIDTARIGADKQSSGIDEETQHTGPAWSAGLRWNPTQSSKVYLRHEGLFRYPFTDEQTSLFGFGDAFLEDLEAENGILYELGGLYSIGTILRFDLRGYFLTMENEIAPNALFVNENLDDTRRLGTEVSLEVLPVKSLELAASYGYVNPVFTGGDNDGNQIPLVSNHEIQGSLTYRGPARLDLSLDGSYRSEYYRGGDNANAQEKIDGYFLLNAGLGWGTEFAEGEFRVRARVDNILDETYAPFVYYSGYYPGLGRSFTLTGNYRF